MKRRGFLGSVLALVAGWGAAKVEPSPVTSGYLEVSKDVEPTSATITVNTTGSFPNSNISWVDVTYARDQWTYTSNNT